METTEYLRIDNIRGESYVLYPNYNEFYPLKVEGLEPPDVDVTITYSGTIDGGTLNNSHIGVRNIVITMVLFGENEEERKKLYRMFPLKSVVTLYYKNTQYNVKTSGHIKHIDLVHYRGKELARIEIVCPDPYLHAVEPITATTAGVTHSCTITNDADCEVGFTANITIDTDETQTLERSRTQSESADYLRQHYAYLLWASFNTFDKDTMSFNLYLDGVYQTPGTDYEHSLLASPYKDMWVEFVQPKLAGGNVMTTEILVVSGERFNNISRNTSKNLTYGTVNNDILFVGLPMADAEDQINVYYDGTKQVIGTDCTIEIIPTGANTDFWIRVNYNHPTDNTKYTEVEIYSDRDGSDVSGKTITRYSTDITLKAFVDYILDPEMPAYDSTKDILWAYIGEKMIDSADYELVTMTDENDNTHTMFRTKNGKYVTSKVTFEVIHSTNGDDIRDYTESEIDDGLLLVNGLSLTNRTTGESMEFPDVKFQKGDKLAISTVPGNLSAIVTESEWMEPGTSLLYEVINNGEFFKIQTGDNILQVSADTNISFVTAEISIERLYGGV